MGDVLQLPVKRPLGLAHDSIAGPSRTKRVRISNQPSVEPSEKSYSTRDESNGPEDELPPLPSEADDADEADDDDEPQAHSAIINENEDEEAAWIRATQIVEKSYRKVSHAENVPAECGIIEEIGCVNFMCHEQLTVKLGPLINFIIGHNGSGKSAVLTALTLCLGGKAAATNRGQSLKSFIKEGRSASTLTVKIKNQGSGAYRPEQYGDSIIVERHFNKEGLSSFKLKDRNGRIVSTKKAELEDIIDWFAMQIDNPLNVLTQDMARQFLSDSNPKDKYKFFLKGTQLETLDRDYLQIQQELDEQEAKTKTLSSDVEVLKNRYEELRKKSEAARGLKKLRDEERVISDQATWAHVVAEEKEAADMETELSRLSRLIGKRKADAEAASEKYARDDDSLNQATTEVEKLQGELHPARDYERDAKERMKEAAEKMRELKLTERQMNGAIEKSQKSIQDTQSQIDEHKVRRAQADGGLHEQKVHELEEAKAAYEERKSAWESHDLALPTLNKSLTEAKAKKQRLVTLLGEKKKEESSLQSRIRNLQQGQRNWTDCYNNGNALEKLVRAIQVDTRFRDRPVGPMGRYVELKDPKWSSILEKSSGPALNGFVVTNKSDQGILSELMRKMNYQAPVYIAPSHRIDTSGNEPDENRLTWMRALNITNDIVRNALIINNNIDQIVLISNRQEASAFAHASPDQRQKVKAVLCWSDTDRRLGHSFSFGGSGSVAFSSIGKWEGPLRMQADEGAQIEDEKANLAKIQEELRDLHVAVQAVQDQLHTSQGKLRDHQKDNAKLKQQMSRARDAMDTLEEEVATSVPDTAQIEQLENELGDHEAQLKLDQDQLQDLQDELDEANRTSRACLDEVNAATKAVRELEAKLEDWRARVHKLTVRRERTLRDKNKAIEEQQEAEHNKDVWQQRRDELQIIIDRHVEEAQRICPRVDVPPGATFEGLQRQLEAKRKERRLMEKELGGSQRELMVKAHEAKKIWEEANQHVKDTVALRLGLANALQHRKERWLHFREAISLRARVTFNYLLAERRFRGELAIDHTNRALEMRIQPDIAVEDQSARQTKTLSGGEKSFSTICLLLALWDAMGSPIRCLDEFDVFMDSVNREISMEMIIAAARNAVGRQYILITPQGMNNKRVDSMTDVRIVRMKDPERGQTALNVGR